MVTSRKRKNIALACDSCRARKIRCDGVEPTCGSCWQRNGPCTYSMNNPRKRLDNRYIREVQNASNCLEATGVHSVSTPENSKISINVPQAPSNCSDGSVCCSSNIKNRHTRAQTRSHQGIAPVDAASTSATPASEDTLSRVDQPSTIYYPHENSSSSDISYSKSRKGQNQLTAMGIASNRPSSTAEGQNEFFGDSSVASFLKEIKVSDAANPRDGSSSRPDPNNVAATSRSAVDPYDLPPRQLADYLLQCYFDKFHSLYPFIHKPSFLRRYNSLWAPTTVVDAESPPAGIGLGDPSVQSSTFLCALNIILALGCQFSHLNLTAREATSADIFERSQRHLNTLSLDRGDLALVQTLLLTATYLQGGESPSKCWNMIGLACRIAQGLGMHSLKADRNRLPAEIQMRRRVWHGCIMFDLASSMMLGRPPMTHASAVPLPDAIDDEALESPVQGAHSLSGQASRTDFYVQTLKLHRILRKILLEVYQPWESTDDLDHLAQTKNEDSHARTLMKLDTELLSFASEVPDALKWNGPHGPSAVGEQLCRESSLLKARFLHLRILLLRPTLVKLCRESRLSQGISECSTHLSPSERQFGPRSKIFLGFSLSCSTYCVETAIELSHLMNEISRTELASIWWYSVFYTFTAGIVLILAQTMSTLQSNFSNQTLTNAWQSCTGCLETMGAYSTTAKYCADSLRRALSQSVSVQKASGDPPPSATDPFLHPHGEEPPPPPIGADLLAPAPAHDPASPSPCLPGFMTRPTTGTDVQPTADLFPLLGLSESEFFGSSWAGSDPIGGSLLEMRWDDFWRTAFTLDES